jgi:regulator of protease activity HflC (stomatin/prohibitin superfamily)
MKNKTVLLVFVLIILSFAVVGCNGEQVISSTDTSDYISSMLATTIEGSSLGAGVIMAVISIIMGMLASGIYIYFQKKRERYNEPKKNPVLLGILIGFVSLILIFTIGSAKASYVVIDEGEVGVVVQQGEYLETLTPGPNFILPYLQKVVVYPTREFTFATMSDPINQGSEQYRTFVMDVTTEKGVTGEIPFLVQAQVNPKKAKQLYTQYGTLENAIVQLIKSPTLSLVRDEIRGQTAEQIAQDIDTFNINVDGDLRPIMEDGGLLLIRFSFRKPDLGEWEIERNATMIAEQQILKEVNLAEVAKAQKQAEFYQAEINADIARQNAEGSADAAVTRAEGQAKVTKVAAEAEAFATLTKANAEAEGNLAVSKSVTPELTEYLKWLNWDGKWPSTYFQGESGGVLFELPVTNSVE